MEHSINKQMGFLFVGRVVSFCLLFALPLVLVRVFSTEDFGLYKQLFLIHETIFLSLTMGVSASIFYFIPPTQMAQQSGIALLAGPYQA